MPGVSAAAFQSALGNLVIDPAWRDAVRMRGAAELPSGLTELERRRLVAVARSKGIGITGTLHKAFRLGKLLATLPLTCALMGDDLLAAELDLFWRSEAPRTFYYVLEALDFCDHVRGRLGNGLACRYLGEVVAYEEAAHRLRLETDAPGHTLEVTFEHDPEVLLGRIAAGEPPGEVPRKPCLVRGTRDAEGNVRWTVAGTGPDAVRA